MEATVDAASLSLGICVCPAPVLSKTAGYRVIGTVTNPSHRRQDSRQQGSPKMPLVEKIWCFCEERFLREMASCGGQKRSLTGGHSCLYSEAFQGQKAWVPAKHLTGFVTPLQDVPAPEKTTRWLHPVGRSSLWHKWPIPVIVSPCYTYGPRAHTVSMNRAFQDARVGLRRFETWQTHRLC